MNAGEPDVLAPKRGCAGFVVLNRPKALNALTLPMLRAIGAALDALERDAGVTRVVFTASAGRAFCAGGDLRALYAQGRAGEHEAQLRMWREEYRLNRRIKRFAKPVVALTDGIVMGGGMGLCAHGAAWIVGENLAFAMPEVGIGFFPDVGATWLLPRLPSGVGAYLALTGARLGAGDALAVGLAQAHVPVARFAELASALEAPGDVAAIVARFAAPAPPSALPAQAEAIAHCFAAPNCAEVHAALARVGSQFADQAALAMAAKSPTSLAIALRQMQVGGTLSFEAALQAEFRIVSRLARGHDFYEGVRAAIVDKDGRPDWRPNALADVAPAEVDRHFAPLGAGELHFSGGPP